MIGCQVNAGVLSDWLQDPVGQRDMEDGGERKK